MMLPLVGLTMASTVLLTDLDLTKIDQQWGQPQIGRSVTKRPLRLAGKEYGEGLGTHANSELIVAVNGAIRFRATVGVDDQADGLGSVRFLVTGDGRVLFDSGVKKRRDLPSRIDLPLKGVKTLVLRADDAGDNNNSDHANWAEAVFEYGRRKPETLDVLPEYQRMINSGKRWFDTRGKLIQAHSGGILKHAGRTYWYGEERTYGYNNKVGVSCYSSTDLLHWRFESIALPTPSFPERFRETGVCERPKVVYNARTKKFVMWSHLDADGYRHSNAGVAVADRPEGPFRFVKAYQPVPGQTFRDMNLLVDRDGSAYVYYSSENNATMYVVRLSDDYLSHAEPMVEGQTWARVHVNEWREAPAPFLHDGKVYLITSGCTGWAPNEARVSVADHPLGPYRTLGNPIVGGGRHNTFGGQSTCVFAPDGARPREFVFMADRWNSENLADSRYLWLPFRIGPSGQVRISWRDAWKP